LRQADTYSEVGLDKSNALPISSDPLNLRVPDEMFAEQAATLELAGFTTSLLPEGLLADGRPLRGIPKA